MKILLVEDNIDLGNTLIIVLQKENYQVDWSQNGIDGLDNALTGIYDVVVVDWKLPEKDGIWLIGQMRKNKLSTPVLMLTSKHEVDDKIQALDVGADDYLCKPFHNREFCARLRALERRRDVYEDNTLSFHELCLNPHSLILSFETEEISISLKESGILEMLMEAKGNTVEKNRMIERVWGYDSNAENNHVEVYISFLRKKLEHIGSNTMIVTKRGIGYALKVNE